MGATVSAKLEGRALAEAAARIMDWQFDDECDMWVKGDVMSDDAPVAWASDTFMPDTLPDADYCCLEWARENWRTALCTPLVEHPGCTWCRFANLLPHASEFHPGDYARALVAAAGGRG